MYSNEKTKCMTHMCLLYAGLGDRQTLNKHSIRNDKDQCVSVNSNVTEL